MPFKNQAKYLEETLDSILAQSFSDWELLAVDDHSTDTSAEIVNAFSTQNSRIKLIKNRKHGVIEALKLGYEETTGRYITRMDADDLMTPNRLELMVRDLKEYGLGHLALGQVHYFKDEGEIGDGYKKYQNWLNHHISNGTCWEDLYRECVIPSPCWMLHREDFNRIGAFNSDTYPEDYDLCFRMYQGGLKCIPQSEVLLHWRDHSVRSSRTLDLYSDNRFLDLKIHYFLKLHHDSTKQLILWGAGKKGKAIAQLLLDRNIKFTWITDNVKKIGRDIYRTILQGSRDVDFECSQVILSVAGVEDQVDIQGRLASFETVERFWFC